MCRLVILAHVCFPLRLTNVPYLGRCSRYFDDRSELRGQFSITTQDRSSAVSNRSNCKLIRYTYAFRMNHAVRGNKRIPVPIILLPLTQTKFLVEEFPFAWGCAHIDVKQSSDLAVTIPFSSFIDVTFGSNMGNFNLYIKKTFYQMETVFAIWK